VIIDTVKEAKNMSEQDFRERILSAVEDLKRTTERIEDRMERMEDRIDKRLTTVEKDVSGLREDVKRTIERIDEKIDDRFAIAGKDVSELRGDVRWIRGKLEGRQEATSSQDAKTALWIALGSALAAIVSLIKSFWA